MEIKFCGAAREVTGSAHLVTLDDGYTILLDCGLYQGNEDDMEDFNRNWYFNPSEIDCVVLSHAHIDHSGRLPFLVKSGFRGSIYCTHATRSLCAIMLLDSAKIQEYDARYQNERAKSRGDTTTITPLYETKHVTETMKLFRSVGYDQWFTIHDGVEVMYKDAGHILGSASVTLRVDGDKYIGFSGDIGRPDRPILRDPEPMPPLDYLICESTYGDRDHISKPIEDELFLKIIRETCVEKGGKVIIPSFSVGRTQDIVYILDQLFNEGLLPKDIPIYVDSPLAINATQVYGTHPECYDDELNEYLLEDDDPFGFNSLTYVRSVEFSKSLNDKKDPCVIISAAGMANAGRVRHHIANNLEDPDNTILLVGYATPSTPAGMLINGVDRLKLFGQWLQVKARVERIDALSAHGDRWEMLSFLKNQQTLKGLYLVHGDYDVQVAWQAFLEKRGFGPIEIPALRDTVKLYPES
ncbi:MBL fold metallo-hydrolase [Membranicola marinus]|uniref:MBL fold metallo-hydrolase n=1 Tax=Membranihabitans marinus TaxID=1227546 RepID=A0A953LCV6_9BACT|nr:MBL fold metallo-hydrolase [Membranihabitans marinus]MBY5959906.1 MBL fold metallo-hydrolase [Membranihabitans marinus]